MRIEEKMGGNRVKGDAIGVGVAFGLKRSRRAKLEVGRGIRLSAMRSQRRL